MKAVILVAGYATRLYPLTLNMPKALLKVKEKPIIDYIVQEIETIDAVDEICVVTNNKFYSHFLNWKENLNCSKKIEVLNDETVDEENKRGAIGDILFVIDKKNINEDIIVVAGDNFFTYRLKDYYDYFKQVDSDCVCVKEIHDKNILSHFGIALLDEKQRIIDIEEKPEHPKSNKVVFASYFYKKETIPMFFQYFKEGNSLDAPGNFVVWLHKRKDVYAYVFNGECYDIGTPEAYKEVCDKFEIL